MRAVFAGGKSGPHVLDKVFIASQLPDGIDVAWSQVCDAFFPLVSCIVGRPLVYFDFLSISSAYVIPDASPC